MAKTLSCVLLLLVALVSFAAGEDLSEKFAALFKKRAEPCFKAKTSYDYILCMAGATIDGVEALVNYPELEPLFASEPRFREDFNKLIMGLEDGRSKCGDETSTAALEGCIDRSLEKMRSDAKRSDKIMEALVASLTRWWRDVDSCSKSKKKFQSCTEEAVNDLFGV